jgi:hypothetical protein
VREELWSQNVNEPTDIPRIPDSGTHARIFQLRSKNGPTIDDIMRSRPGWTWRTPPPKTCEATNAIQFGGQHVQSGRPKCLADWSLPPAELWAVSPTGRQASAKARAFVGFMERQLSGEAE